MYTMYVFLIFNHDEMMVLLFVIIICNIADLVLRGCFFIFMCFLGIVRFLGYRLVVFGGFLELGYWC